MRHIFLRPLISWWNVFPNAWQLRSGTGKFGGRVCRLCDKVLVSMLESYLILDNICMYIIYVYNRHDSMRSNGMI